MDLARQTGGNQGRGQMYSEVCLSFFISIP
nr:MAG TPA: Plastocyanin, Cytochrome f transport, Metal-binding, Transport [Caudoviricetes sp.]